MTERLEVMLELPELGLRLLRHTHLFGSKDYWIDANQNHWSADKYTSEQAAAASKTMKQCARCLDCEECTNCTDCHLCFRCEDCDHCLGCEDCRGLTRKANKKHTKWVPGLQQF